MAHADTTSRPEPPPESCWRWLVELVAVWLAAMFAASHAISATVAHLCPEQWAEDGRWKFCQDNMPRVSMFGLCWAVLTVAGFTVVRLVTVWLRRRRALRVSDIT